MIDLNDSDELKDLMRRKSKLARDPSKIVEYGDVVYSIGYFYYQKGYYKEALEEFEQALEIRKKLPINIDIAITHRFLGEAICKLGNGFERAKREFDTYHSITCRLRDLVENQRSYTTLGNFYMTLAEENYKSQRVDHLNAAYSNYLKSYDLLSEISEKRLVDAKEFALMKARTCLNCAFAMDEKRDTVICNEYLKSAIEICESNRFYEDLIRCLYIKVEQAKRKNKMEDMIKTADRVIETTVKTRDVIQQAYDFALVADIYLKNVQNFEKAKVLLRKAYKLRKKCHIDPSIIRKLKEVMNIIKVEKEIHLVKSTNESGEDDNYIDLKLLKMYEKLGDSFCNIGMYELGLRNYFEQLKLSKKCDRPNSELSVIYASIAQTNQDLDRSEDALKYFELELNTFTLNSESECKSWLNIAHLKEKLHMEFNEIESVYLKAYDKAKEASNYQLEYKTLKLLKEAQKVYGISFHETEKKIISLSERTTISLNENSSSGQGSSDKDDEEVEDENENDESLIFSESDDDDEFNKNYLIDEEKIAKQTNRSTTKKSIVKRNLRGETQLHVACIKGNFSQAKKLIDDGHPVNERDNLNWLPIHEACNYGHVEIVDLLIKHGAKINDSVGPITPLHDAAQNGHLEVVKLLLKAGALTYVFNHDGYTPLDFLCKYKEEFENKLSPDDLSLINKLHDFMLNSIRTKDKNYKVKKVINSEVNVLVDVGEVEEENEISSKSGFRNKLIDLNSEDDDDKDGRHQSSSTKKKNSVRQYKEAINQIGSKSNKIGSATTGKKVIDKVIVSETEYNINDNWLINDIEKKSHQAQKHNKTSSSKRKFNFNSDLEEEDDEEEVNSTNEIKNNAKSKIGFESDEDDFDIFLKNKKVNNKSTNGEKFVKSPISKKRFIDSNYEERQRESLELLKDAQSINLNEDIQFDFNLNMEFESSNKVLKTKHDSPTKLKDKINADGDDEDIISIKPYIKKGKDVVDLTIVSPFKNSAQVNIMNNNRTKKVQLKLDKMQNYNIKSSIVPQNNNSNQFSMDKQNENILTTKPQHKPESKETQSQNWKVKAIIDNRNFLIPVSNINATIDTLSEQIVTRYKTIFSNDPTYREPEKVILKSSDDLILFGQDLIKDVLTNFCQVHLIIEKFKNAPKLGDIYEQTCISKGLDIYSSLQTVLKESETNFYLNLKEIKLDNERASKQFYAVFDSVKISSKQTISNNSYFTNLAHIDLSSNMIDDEMFTYFIENVLIECLNLKGLNVSFNLVTAKSLKALDEMANSIKTTRNSSLFPLEYLNMNGNDIGSWNSNLNTDIFNLLNNLICHFQHLKELHISDCKLNFSESDIGHSSIKFFNSIKNSNLTDFDISFNNIGYRILTSLVENFPESQIENLNFSNCLINKNSFTTSRENDYKMEMFTSITKFISFSLKSLSLRNLNLESQQTTDIISCLGVCSQLKQIDLSYNYFEKSLIKLLFTECVKLEESLLVNNSDAQDENQNWCDIIAYKFDNCTIPLKRLEIKAQGLNEKSELKNIFCKKWHKNSVRLQYHSKNIIEMSVS